MTNMRLSPIYRSLLLGMTLLGTTLLLGACANLSTPPVPQTEASWKQRQQALSQLNRWQASGKLALRSGEQAESATLLWRQRDKHSELLLSGPLGMASTRILSDGQQLRIERGDERHSLDISTPGALQAYTGWDLPLAALPYWMRGLPQPGAAASTFELETGYLRHLRHAGWEVSFKTYGQFGALSLPTQLEVRNNETLVRLLLRHWQVGGEQ